MAVHEKAWAGVHILVKSPEPLLPAKLAEAMSRATPANEVRISSYESYNDAYDFCQAQKDVGLVLLTDLTDDGVSPASQLKELGSHYESRGWPCAGVLLHHAGASLAGYRALRENRNFLCYKSTDDLLSPARTAETLKEVWNLFSSHFEQAVVPEPLQNTLLALAEQEFSVASYRFCCRILNVLIPHLNVSWMESVALRWAPVVEALHKTAPASLKTNPGLLQMASLANRIEGVHTFEAILKHGAPLVERVSTLCQILDHARLEGTLEGQLQVIGSLARPGSPALVRRTAAARDAIRQFAFECENAASEEAVG